MTASSPADGRSWLWLWKSRLPIIIVPVLTCLRQLSGEPSLGGKHTEWPQLEFALLFSIAIGTGIAHLPFSVTWWFVLLAAFTLQTTLLIGVATILSLSVALAWYGVQLQHPHAFMALWGGAKGEKEGIIGIPLVGWRMWDLCVHGFPALMMIWWFGPSVATDGTVVPGVVTMSALTAALPLTLVWLWGVGFRLPAHGADARPKSLLSYAKVTFADSNVVYAVVPDLPPKTWENLYSLHLVVCIVWMACLGLHREILLANAIFAVSGLCWLPFTFSWWLVFILTLVQGDQMPVLRGMCGCVAAPVALGWYGTQLLHPDTFMTLVNVWVVHPVEALAPNWFSARFLAFSKSKWFEIIARLGDLCLHFISTMSALYLFRGHITVDIALAALPGNMVYWGAFALTSGARRLADTNWIYGVCPNLPSTTWRLIFGSHWAFCSLVYCVCSASSILSA